MIDEAGIVEHLSWAESVAVASFQQTRLVRREDLRAYAAEALCVLAHRFDADKGSTGGFGGFVRTRLRYTITDLLRRDFGRTSSAKSQRSVHTVSLETAVHENRHSGLAYCHPDEAHSAVPKAFLVDCHEDDVVDRLYARQVADALDPDDPGDWVVAETAKGRTLEEVGRQLGVTESRACQLRTAARRRLKARLAY